MEFIDSHELNTEQKVQIMELWNAEYPSVIAHKDIASFEKYLNGLADKNHLLIQDERGKIIGWFVDFIRDGERWFAMILTSEIQGKGYGRKLLEMARKRNPVLNGWAVESSDLTKIDGTAYPSPLGFYKKIGFDIFPEIKFETEIMTTVKIRWEGKSLPSKY